MKFRVLPEARAELVEAADWYDRRQSALGNELLSEVDAAFESIRSRPQSLPAVERYGGKLDLRRLLLKKFPYVIYVVCREDEVIVASIAHARRRPLYWLNRVN